MITTLVSIILLLTIFKKTIIKKEFFKISLYEQIITIFLCVIGTMLTRFLPFLIFLPKRPIPKYIQYLGDILTSALFGTLVIYSLKDINVLSGNYGIPELISIFIVAFIHLWKRKMMLSIVSGTATYMILIQFIF
ncbi:MAG: AzlD domain-containing protein [Clostridium sp.]|nr:AzlD domain-containing protein [Clostridium sp.]